jgi:hypothetical protein
MGNDEQETMYRIFRELATRFVNEIKNPPWIVADFRGAHVRLGNFFLDSEVIVHPRILLSRFIRPFYSHVTTTFSCGGEEN